MRAALFCHNGLGDGINSLVLSQNLFLAGWAVDTYHNGLHSMQNWLPHLPIHSYPELTAVAEIVERYDWLFIVQNKSSSWVAALIAEGKRQKPDRVKVIYLYPSKNIVKEPFYNDAKIDPFLPVAENMRLFCQNILGFSNPLLHSGLTPPLDLGHRSHPSRVVVHSTSGKEERNWPKEKFVKLALHIQQRGYEVVFLSGAQDDDFWRQLGFGVAASPTLDSLAAFLYESGYLIGNDSGPGHLASALAVPTLTLFPRAQAARMWRPSFTRGVVVAPSRWIPNIEGLRLRDRHWKRWVTVAQAFKGFERLIQGR